MEGREFLWLRATPVSEGALDASLSEDKLEQGGFKMDGPFSWSVEGTTVVASLGPPSPRSGLL